MDKKNLKKSFKKKLSRKQKEYLKLILLYRKVIKHSYFAKDNQYYFRLLSGFVGKLDLSQKKVLKKVYGIGIPNEKLITLFTPENFKDKSMYDEIVYNFHLLLSKGETLLISYQRVSEENTREIVAIPFPNPDKSMRFQKDVVTEVDMLESNRFIRVLNASNKEEKLYLFKISSITILPF